MGGDVAPPDDEETVSEMAALVAEDGACQSCMGASQSSGPVAIGRGVVLLVVGLAGVAFCAAIRGLAPPTGAVGPPTDPRMSARSTMELGVPIRADLRSSKASETNRVEGIEEQPTTPAPKASKTSRIEGIEDQPTAPASRASMTNRTTLVVESDQCSNDREGCLDTRCCIDPDVHCYQKNGDWAQCRRSCHNGAVDLRSLKDPWTCNRLDVPEADAEQGFHSESCAGDGENCMASRCCRNARQGCFKKDDSWAGCRDACQEGHHDPFGPDRTPWSCEQLGAPREAKNGAHSAEPTLEDLARPCSDNASNCHESHCCVDPGHVCYEKHQDWAQCRVECHKNWIDTDGPDRLPWSCRELGPRAPTPKVVDLAPGAEPSPPQDISSAQHALEEYLASGAVHCSAVGDDCSQTGCCKDVGFRCYEKNRSYSGCRQDCKTGLVDLAGDLWTCVERSPEQSSDVSESTTTNAIGSYLDQPNPHVSTHAVFADAHGVFDVALDAFMEEIEETDRMLSLSRENN